MNGIIKHIISNEKDFAELKGHWKELETGSEMTCFQSYEWNKLLYSIWNKRVFNRLLYKIVVYEAKTVIAPLIVPNYNFVCKLLGKKAAIRFLGTGGYSDYLNFIYSEASSLESVIKHIKEENHSFRLWLGDVDQDCSVNGILADYKASEMVCVGVKVENSVEEYNAKLSKHTKQNLRTAHNRMEKDSIQYAYEIKLGILDDVLIEKLCQIHFSRVMNKNKIDGSSLKSRIRSTIHLYRLKNSELHTNVIKDAMKTMDDSFTLLVKLNGEIVGYLYGFVERGRIVRICQNCFNEEYHFYSPVFRACYDFLCDCCGHHEYEWIDFTRGDESYKYKLGGVEKKIISYEV